MTLVLRTRRKGNANLSYSAQFGAFLFAWLVPTVTAVILLALFGLAFTESHYDYSVREITTSLVLVATITFVVLSITVIPLAIGASAMRVFLRFGWGGWCVSLIVGAMAGLLFGSLVDQLDWIVTVPAGAIHAAALWIGLYRHCPEALRHSDAAPRTADATELPAFADLWHAGWVEAHADHVPDDLLRLRTRESFLPRLEAMGDKLRVLGSAENPQGFYAIDGDKLDQLFVGQSERGTGVTARLLADAETRMAKAGVTEAHLHCLPENKRAARFYEKSGWQDCGVERHGLDSSEGPFELDVLVFRKTL